MEASLNNSKTNINFDSSTLTIGGNAFFLPYNNNIEIPSAVINYSAGKFSGQNTSVVLTSGNALFLIKGIGGLQWGKLAHTSGTGKARIQVDSISLRQFTLSSETFTTGTISMDTLTLAKGKLTGFRKEKIISSNS